jgi:phosphatidylglycerophosphatase B
VSVLLLAAGVFVFPVEHVFRSNNTLLISCAFWFTESAGQFGTLILIAGAGYFYAQRYGFWRAIVFSFLRSVCSMLAFLLLFALVNEYLTKPLTKAVRPSHRFMLTETSNLSMLDSVYNLSKEDRRQFFTQLVTNNRARFNNIDGKVVQHWLTESGYSFPSGHSFNAFLLATVFAFSLYTARNKGLHSYYILPFIWAVLVGVSRVMIGAHAPLDVAVGAAMGLLVSVVFLYFDTTRKWIVHTKNK